MQEGVATSLLHIINLHTEHFQHVIRVTQLFLFAYTSAMLVNHINNGELLWSVIFALIEFLLFIAILS